MENQVAAGACKGRTLEGGLGVEVEVGGWAEGSETGGSECSWEVVDA